MANIKSLLTVGIFLITSLGATGSYASVANQLSDIIPTQEVKETTTQLSSVINLKQRIDGFTQSGSEGNQEISSSKFSGTLTKPETTNAIKIASSSYFVRSALLFIACLLYLLVAGICYYTYRRFKQNRLAASESDQEALEEDLNELNENALDELCDNLASSMLVEEVDLTSAEVDALFQYQGTEAGKA